MFISVLSIFVAAHRAVNWVQFLCSHQATWASIVCFLDESYIIIPTWIPSIPQTASLTEGDSCSNYYLVFISVWNEFEMLFYLSH